MVRVGAFLTATVLLAGLLIYTLAKVKATGGGTRRVENAVIVLALFPLIFYIIPLAVLIFADLVKMVGLGDVTAYQFGQYVRYELIPEFNGYFVAAWNWSVRTIKGAFER